MSDTIGAQHPTPVVPRLEIYTKYGGVYAGTSMDFSADVAEYFNRRAAAATGVLPGEFVPFEAGECCTIACPTPKGLPRQQFIEAYQKLRVRLDGELEFHLGDFPRLFQADPLDLSIYRRVPTYIPKARFPPDFFGRRHTLELFQADDLIFGPVERFFHTPATGCTVNRLEDGHGCLMVELQGDLSLERSGRIIYFTDPVFGKPLGAAQLNDDGSTVPLEYEFLGPDCLGDTVMVNEGAVEAVKRPGRSVVIELYLPRKGTGLAGAVLMGHSTQARAYRADATVHDPVRAY